MYELSYSFSALINIMCNAILHKIYVFVALFFFASAKGAYTRLQITVIISVKLCALLLHYVVGACFV